MTANPSAEQYQIPPSFAEITRRELSSDSQDPLPSLYLQLLEICVVDPSNVLQGALGLHLNLKYLKALRLESCRGLPDALAMFANDNESAKSFEMPKLTALLIRHELLNNQRNDLRKALERFLKSLCGLTQFEVHLDNTEDRQELGPILEKHGQTLRPLLWEERRGPRTCIDIDTSILPDETRPTVNLEIDSEACPNLIALALLLDWNAVTESDKHHKAVSVNFI